MERKRTLLAAVLAAGLVAAGAAAQAKEFVKLSTLGPGSSPYLVMSTFANIVNQSVPDLEVQVNATGAATKHAVQAAEGKIDLFMSSPLVHTFMMGKKAMYQKMDNAPELAKNLRTLFNFPIGIYHFVVYADSGIQDMKDIKGKTVFLGPPTGAASRVTAGLIKAVTGYEEGKDYKAVKMGWGAASQAFQDKQLDVYCNPTNAPSPVISQVALTNKIRILGLSDADLKNPAVRKLIDRPGGGEGTIPAGVYGKNQVNTEGAKSVASWVGIGAGKHLSDEAAYNMVKAFWTKVPTMEGDAPWLRNLKVENAFTQINIPLHPGAARYYKEIGLTIPEKAMSPQ
ncbi:MAG: TAXI family TRAP transporter solute-binding subunit [Hyphomicrobiales bacterium]|nr:TAXI family TRAP transporter solute-binding subunit [Hyphomicrobiales bacterium]MCP5372841.1 TAXI family TRAP transporter solute-binding subunit [Hyphomicrobiales bacterium]